MKQNYSEKLNEFIAEEKAATDLMNSVGKLLYEKGIELVLFRRHLIDENVSEIDRKVMIENGESIVGELVVSAELVLKQSIQNGWNFNTELFRLIAHGCAHLAGYNHEDSQKEADKMLELEIKLLKKIGLTKIY